MKLHNIYEYITDATRQQKETIKAWAKKANLDGDELIAKVESMAEGNNAKQVAFAKWICNGVTDERLLNQTYNICTIKKLNPLKQNPESLVSEVGEEVVVEPINPDNVLTDRQEDGEGNVSYAARDEDKDVIRDIINTHWGIDANPWCLMVASGGKRKREADDYWDEYDAYPKRIAFRNGKLLAFSAGRNDFREWWDKQDRSFKFIPYNGKVWSNDMGDVFKIQYGHVYKTMVVPHTGATSYGKLSEGYSTDIETAHTDITETGGQLFIGGNKANIISQDDKYYHIEVFHDDYVDKLTISKKKLTREGKYECVRENGRVSEVGNYVNDKPEGEWVTYYADGGVFKSANYVNGVLSGVMKKYYRNGLLYEIIPFKRGQKYGEVKEYDDNGKLLNSTTYVNDKREGLSISYDKNGKISDKRIFKDDEMIEWGIFEDGVLNSVRTFSNGNLVKIVAYDTDGNIVSTKEY